MPSATLLSQSILSGIFVGGLYGLLGLGLSLSWGMLRQINLAHFALAFLGAYLTYQLGSHGWDPLLTLIVIVPAFFVFGVAMHWVFARLAVTPFNSLLATFGLAVIIESAIQFVWSADYRKLESAYAAVKFKIGALYLPLPELISLALATALAFATWVVLRHTELGKAMRATAEDAPIAAAFGINTRLLERMLAGLCAAFAGVAGVALALTYTLAPSQIYSLIGVVFAVVMVGGLGNPFGPLIAGVAIGISEAVTMAVTAPAWAPLVSFSLLIVVLLTRARRT
ncbi:MAG TPA: branched-chain amino acid ABC transporter permease [Magnetospirillaceae bacterium]|jgi:branched-chain amino acid transport system permease protein